VDQIKADALSAYLFSKESGVRTGDRIKDAPLVQPLKKLMKRSEIIHYSEF
jgi:hypothetical protein